MAKLKNDKIYKFSLSPINLTLFLLIFCYVFKLAKIIGFVCNFYIEKIIFIFYSQLNRREKKSCLRSQLEINNEIYIYMSIYSIFTRLLILQIEIDKSNNKKKRFCNCSCNNFLF